LRSWLNKAAQIFETQVADGDRRPLLRHRAAPYEFDVIYGLTYDIDLSKDCDRIVNLRHAGKAVDDTDQFAVATNSYRAHGGGGFFKVGPNDVLDVTATGARDLLVDYLRKRGTVTGQAETIWRFAPLSSAHAAVYSAPQAKPQSRPHKLCTTQTTADGFAVFDLKL
jgi:2',3'-cyclic-nucleotide 2'-phosphodiesterase/3'-nucleotidase